MKRDWVLLMAQAEARGEDEQVRLYAAQIRHIRAMLQAVGADPDMDPPRRTHS